MPELTIRSIEDRDLDQIADIHRASFHDRALSQLGNAAIKRYYNWLLRGFPDNFPFCAVSENGWIAGFCFAGDYSGSFSGFLQHNRGFLIRTIILRPWLIFNPLIREQSKLAIKTLMSLLKMRMTKQVSLEKVVKVKANAFKSFGILAIAVNPDFQRQGIGQLLMETAENRAITNGYQQMHLSVHPENIPAVRFYEKLGWYKIPPGENWYGKMTKKLN